MPTVIFKSNLRFEGSVLHLLAEDLVPNLTPQIRYTPWTGSMSYKRDFTEKDDRVRIR